MKRSRLKNVLALFLLDFFSAPDFKKFEVPVKEWIIRRGTTKIQCEMVTAYPVDWKTPSIERMWLGTNVEDKTRRLRAFLTCMESDTPLMLNTQYVPQQLLLLCCVLRYNFVNNCKFHNKFSNFLLLI